jgi:large subunit ribosomal protein L3
MPRKRRPLRGSHAFYPRKRAERIYPGIKNAGKTKEVKPLAFAGYKAGMSHAIIVETNPNSQFSGKDVSKAFTVLECPPLSVFGFRCYTLSEENKKISICDVFAEKLNKNLKRATKLPKNLGSLEKIQGKNITDVSLLCHTNPTFKKTPEIFEIPLGGDDVKQKLEYAKQVLGKEIKIHDIFKDGDYVDVSAVTKGKGFEGPVRRFGVVVLGRKYQQMHRHVGSLGAAEPGKIRPTVPAAGQHGFQTRTEFNKRILKIQSGFDAQFVNYGPVKSDAILLEGSVPGSKKRLIMLRMPLRAPTTKYPVQIKEIVR